MSSSRRTTPPAPRGASLASRCSQAPSPSAEAHQEEAELDTKILSGKPIASDVLSDVAARAAAVAGRRGLVRLAVLQVGDDPASGVYCASIERAATKAGVGTAFRRLPQGAATADVARALRGLSLDPSIDGVVIQQPLPRGVDPSVVDELAPEKDVDGATATSLGLLAAGRPLFAPCTPLAVIEILVRSGVSIPGKHVVVVGRSSVVGRPLAALLLLKSPRGNATVTVCHTATPDVGRHTRSGDVVVAAMGCPRALTGDMISEGAVVVDVGINSVGDPAAERGLRIVGDVAFDEVLGKAAAVTPVPGGVGSLTTAVLLRSVVEAAERRA